jgi:hypothetical protein
MADLKDIELARPGQWNLGTGPIEVTARMLDDAARFANREGGRPGYLKLGHHDPRFVAADGDPAMGWLTNIRVEEDGEPVLKGDLTGVPDWLATAIPRHWPDRSIEGYKDYVHEGQTYGLVVDGLALLGVTPPGMKSIRSLRDLPAALGIAASGALPPSGQRICASFGTPQTPASADVPSTRQGAGMDPVLIREALGLDPDASDDEVKASAVMALAITNDGPATSPELVNASGTMRVDASAWNEREERIKRLEASAAQVRRNERDQIITEAIQRGKFAPARRSHWERMWDADPEGARQIIDGLAANLIPVMASGYSGGPEAEAEEDREFAHLFPPKVA